MRIFFHVFPEKNGKKITNAMERSESEDKAIKTFMSNNTPC